MRRRNRIGTKNGKKQQQQQARVIIIVYRIKQSTQYELHTLEIHCIDLVNLLISLYCSYYCIIWRTETAMVAPKNIKLSPIIYLMYPIQVFIRYLLSDIWKFGYKLQSAVFLSKIRRMCRKASIFLPNINGILVGPSPMVWQPNIGLQGHIVVWATTLGESAIRHLITVINFGGYAPEKRTSGQKKFLKFFPCKLTYMSHLSPKFQDHWFIFPKSLNSPYIQNI